MSETKRENMIREITRDIESYREAIENAEGALAEAERELDEILAEEFGKEDHGQEHP